MNVAPIEGPNARRFDRRATPYRRHPRQPNGHCHHERCVREFRVQARSGVRKRRDPSHESRKADPSEMDAASEPWWRVVGGNGGRSILLARVPFGIKPSSVLFADGSPEVRTKGQMISFYAEFPRFPGSGTDANRTLKGMEFCGVPEARNCLVALPNGTSTFFASENFAINSVTKWNKC